MDEGRWKMVLRHFDKLSVRRRAKKPDFIAKPDFFVVVTATIKIAVTRIR